MRLVDLGVTLRTGLSLFFDRVYWCSYCNSRRNKFSNKCYEIARLMLLANPKISDEIHHSSGIRKKLAHVGQLWMKKKLTFVAASAYNMFIIIFFHVFMFKYFYLLYYSYKNKKWKFEYIFNNFICLNWVLFFRTKNFFSKLTQNVMSAICVITFYWHDASWSNLHFWYRFSLIPV